MLKYTGIDANKVAQHPNLAIVIHSGISYLSHSRKIAARRSLTLRDSRYVLVGPSISSLLDSLDKWKPPSHPKTSQDWRGRKHISFGWRQKKNVCKCGGTMLSCEGSVRNKRPCSRTGLAVMVAPKNGKQLTPSHLASAKCIGNFPYDSRIFTHIIVNFPHPAKRGFPIFRRFDHMKLHGWWNYEFMFNC